ncbi:MAG: FAD-binding protein [Actinomycetota bacterium]|nr:FAD-binding protein [Actinomycetota bacterium]
MSPASEPLDLLVLGSGVAGLSAAVRAAARPGLRVGVLTKAALDQATTRWAQGGVAAVLSPDEDSTDLHLADTLAAGAGLCDVDAVRAMVDEGPARVHELIALGAVFDRDQKGALQLAREGGHSWPRVVHAGGAATGVEVERALVEAAHAIAAAVLEGWFAVDLLVVGGRCRGVVAIDDGGRRREVRAAHVLLATGGVGQLFTVTTNPTESTGDGLAMALRAGVAVADVEFVQFHPTALHHPSAPRPLLSEALRGHGAVVRDARGERFVDELVTRDQLSRAMTTTMAEQAVSHLWLDVTHLEHFDQRFPTIAATLRGVGLDPGRDWLPIAPAAHYVCGGVVTDLDGASSLPGLWACGEVACTGVHGANRLASNSLLEGMVFAPRVVEAIEAGRDGPRPTGAMRAVLDGKGGEEVVGGRRLPDAERWFEHLPGRRGADEVRADEVRADEVRADEVRADLQRAMAEGAGVVRDAASLASVTAALRALVLHGDALGDDRSGWEVRNLLAVGTALVEAARARTESRGCHGRSDHPEADPSLRLRLVRGPTVLGALSVTPWASATQERRG